MTDLEFREFLDGIDLPAGIVTTVLDIPVAELDLPRRYWIKLVEIAISDLKKAEQFHQQTADMHRFFRERRSLINGI
jgi:hypothetical protein